MKSLCFAGNRCGGFFKTASAVVVALLVLLPAVVRGAKGDLDVLVAPDRTVAGKKFVLPTEKKPLYCMIISAGPSELGAVFAGEKIPALKVVEPLVKKALAKQHYLEVDEAHPEPSLIIVYSWGSINPDEMASDDPNMPAQMLNQSQMLSIVTTKNIDLTPGSVDRNLFVPDLNDGRYFLLVGAYDYAALKAGKPRPSTMLWRTRLSTYNSGGGSVALDQALPRMLEVGASSFGVDGYPEELRSKMRKGTVTVGDAEVVEYIVSGTTVIPAPARAKKIVQPQAQAQAKENVPAKK